MKPLIITNVARKIIIFKVFFKTLDGLSSINIYQYYQEPNNSTSYYIYCTLLKLR